MKIASDNAFKNSQELLKKKPRGSLGSSSRLPVSPSAFGFLTDLSPNRKQESVDQWMDSFRRGRPLPISDPLFLSSRQFPTDE